MEQETSSTLYTEILFCSECENCGKDFEEYYIFQWETKLCKECLLKDVECKGNARRLCDKRECKACFDKSFASHDKSLHLKNKDEARKIFKGSDSKKVWFSCGKCNHPFEAVPYNVLADSWCPFCNNRKLCPAKENCEYCKVRSLASLDSEIVEAYKKALREGKNTKPPEEVFKSSRKKVWFSCDKCNHSFDMRLYHVSSGRWCPFSNNRKLCPAKEKCGYCRDNSLASLGSEIVEAYEKEYKKGKNTKPPEEIFKGSGTKVWFSCAKCNHPFKATPYSVLADSWCPYCVNKTEAKLFDWLQKEYPNLFERQKKYEDLKDKKCLPFDFCHSQYPLHIELDGLQHFEQVSNWDLERTKKRDKMKHEYIKDKNMFLIRLLQDDVWKGTYKWEEKLKETIDSIVEGCHPNGKIFYLLDENSNDEEYKSIYEEHKEY